MAIIGYHASHEQFSPGELLQLLQQAQQAGFNAGMCSDHFHPWSAEQGHSGFAWTWLGAAMQATNLSLGVVNAPGYRYHPALIAQASATLAQMYPGRFWLAAGSGEALNECMTGGRWPPKAERNARLLEAVAIIRALWDGNEVSHDGLITIDRARLYTLPPVAPPIYAAALSVETARWAGAWADGLITVSAPPETQQRIIDAFREGGGEGKPLVLQVKVSYAEDADEALRGAHQQWRSNVLPGQLPHTLQTPEDFAAAASLVRPEDLFDQVRIGSDLGRHAAQLQADLDQGFERIYLHNVNRHQQAFIDAFGASVLPRLK
jgi:probable non-F420 flavinoid oxidoreductase